MNDLWICNFVIQIVFCTDNTGMILKIYSHFFSDKFIYAEFHEELEIYCSKIQGKLFSKMWSNFRWPLGTVPTVRGYNGES